MGEPVNTKIIGGVRYNANQFTAKELGNGKFELKAKNGGETLIFPQQPVLKPLPEEQQTNGEMVPVPGDTHGAKYNSGIFRETNPRIELKTNKNLMYDDNYFTISDMMGATFTSSKNTVAHVKLEDSEDTKINLAANDSKWYGDHANIQGGQRNKVILDKEDSARINGRSVEGKGTADQKDYINE